MSPGRCLLTVLRAAISLALLASQLVVATAQHHHALPLAEGLLEDDAALAQEIHEVSCRTPNAIHWHADRTVEIEPCLACLRQHLAGVEVAAPAQTVIPAVTVLDPDAPSSPVAGFILDASSRGPPAVV